jgi:exodeoxyribonuclease-5
VLNRNGCPATTIHSLIYLPREKSTERLVELRGELAAAKTDDERKRLTTLVDEEKRNLRRPSFTLNLDSPLRNANLLVIDECSMVDQNMGHDLLSFGCRVLVLGDPAQLPPVRGGGFFTEGRPDVLLTDIHRQARDNPIVDLATRIRKGEQWVEHPAVRFTKPSPDQAMAADQIIVGMNRTRHAVNRRMRQLHRRLPALPVPGDKVVCVRNNHELGIMNGATYQVIDAQHDDAHSMIRLDTGQWVHVHPEGFTGQEIELWRAQDAESFEYGYALTCHKSQGSQWDNVMVFDESWVFKRDAMRWLYTAVTRAAKQLTVVTT